MGQKEKICQKNYNKCLAREDQIKDQEYKDIKDLLKKAQVGETLQAMT